MERITEVTRRDIIEIIKNGIVTNQFNQIFDFSYKVKMPYYGTLDELSFLARVYDLKKMPSYDKRHENAYDELKCHLYLGDYLDCWFFDDDRFMLGDGDGDKTLLKFVCEMFHPLVRDENSEWQLYLKKFNELLRNDGYEIYAARKISGKDEFDFREYKKIEFPSDLFSNRYKKMIDVHSEPKIDNISGMIDKRIKRSLCEVMDNYAEPLLIKPLRYDNLTEQSDACEYALKQLNGFLDTPCIDINAWKQGGNHYLDMVTSVFTPYLFDAIELQYAELSELEKSKFSEAVNEVFKQGDIFFKLNEDGLIELQEKAGNLFPLLQSLNEKITEPGLKELINTAWEYHNKSDIESHQIAVEKLWDAFERLKTYYCPSKKDSVSKLINKMSKEKKDYSELFDEEFSKLTKIGNSFRIRHHENGKIEIDDIRYCDYFYNRCMSLISLAIQFLQL